MVLIYHLLTMPQPEVRHYVGEPGPQGAQGVQGVQGVAGESIQGAQGIQGTPGEAGKTIERVVVQPEPVKAEPGPTGPQGEKGEMGEPGRSPELRHNPETGDVEWKLEGDRFWQVLLPSCVLKEVECVE